MAQQVVIDIIAETAKLNSGINEANTKLGGLQTSLGGAAKAAVGLASGLVLREGVTFVSEAIKEAQDAAIAFAAANTVFKDSPGLLAQLQTQADTLGLALGKDNDEIIGLATALGQRLPPELDALSVSLVGVGADIAAASGGTITLDGWVSKLAKSFATGEVEVKKLQKIFPGLTDSVWAQVEALVKNGDKQAAMNVLIGEATKKYGGAAAEQVTSTQKIQTAIADLKEKIGTALMPAFEKLVGILQTAIKFIIDNKEVMIPLITTVAGLAAGIAALNVIMTGFDIVSKAINIVTGIFTAKTIAQTAATGAATVAQTGFNLAMLANPITIVIVAIVALIAIIVLLVQNWDKVSAVLADVWKNISSFVRDAGKAIGDWVGSVGKFLAGLWKSFTDTFAGIAKNVGSFIGDLIKDFLAIPGKLINIGKDIVTGLWTGMTSMVNWIKDKVFGFFGSILPGWAQKVLGIHSPSKVFAGFGENIVQGLAKGINDAENLAKQAMVSLGAVAVDNFNVPTLNPSVGLTGASGAPINITINAGLGTDPYQLGKAVTSAVNKYGKVARVV